MNVDWINIHMETPDENEFVLCHLLSTDILQCQWSEGRFWPSLGATLAIYNPETGEMQENEVTHWIHSPESPKLN